MTNKSLPFKFGNISWSYLVIFSALNYILNYLELLFSL